MICIDCKKRESKVSFSTEPVYAMTHGLLGIPLCRQCYIKRIESELQRVNKNLNEQKKLLKEEE